MNSYSPKSLAKRACMKECSCLITLHFQGAQSLMQQRILFKHLVLSLYNVEMSPLLQCSEITARDLQKSNFDCAHNPSFTIYIMLFLIIPWWRLMQSFKDVPSTLSPGSAYSRVCPARDKDEMPPCPTLINHFIPQPEILPDRNIFFESFHWALLEGKRPKNPFPRHDQILDSWSQPLPVMLPSTPLGFQ